MHDNKLMGQSSIIHQVLEKINYQMISQLVYLHNIKLYLFRMDESWMKDTIEDKTLTTALKGENHTVTLRTMVSYIKLIHLYKKRHS